MLAPGGGQRLALLIIFFCSGVAGLMYEVVWTRQLSLVFGVTTYAVATVLAIYMGGLALGSALVGRWSDRWRDVLRAYALLELGVGLYALAVPWLFGLLRPAYIALHHLELPYLALALGRAGLAAALLLVPTTLMGGTFPLLVRFFARAPREVGRAAGLLYFTNTAGAVAGCLIAGFVLIERLGLIGTTTVAAALSLASGVAALALGRQMGRLTAAVDVAPPTASTAPAAAEPADGRLALVLLCIALSGFTALAYEVVWSRALLRYLYNSTYAFTAMLATFLAGLTLGGAVYTRFLRGRAQPLLIFAALEVLVGAGFVLSTRIYEHLLGASALLMGGDVVASFGQSVLTMFLRAAMVLFIPTVFLGATLPLATEICAKRLATLGRTTGAVYGLNTFGAILGSLGSAFVLIPWLGMHGALRMLIAVNIGMGLVLALAAPLPARRRLAAAGGLAALAAVAFAVLPGDVFRNTFAPKQSLAFYHEGATDTVGVVESWGQRTMLYDDHRGTSGTMMYPWNYLLGHLPILLHHEPRRVLHICFGVGNSLNAVTAHPSVERIDNVELSPHVLDAGRYFWTNDGVLDDPKVRTIIDDGRNFIMASREQYDVIMLEPPEIFTAGVINLYTREFYQDAAARLAPGGLMMQWLPLGEAPVEQEQMLFRAFADVFPHATLWRLLEDGPLLFVGSMQPLTIDYQQLAARMGQGRVRDDFELIKIDGPDHFLSFFLFDEPTFRDFAMQAPPVTDDKTVLDFAMPRFLGSGFGFGTFALQVQQDGQSPFAAINERTRFFEERHRPVAPLLTNLGADTPEAVQQRVDALRAAERPKRPPIAQKNWRPRPAGR